MKQLTFRRVFSATLILILLAVIVGVCDFKVQDPDFWWHIKTGEIMFRTRSFIRVEPYLYILKGHPFRIQFEWLSQIILFLLYQWGGAPAIILWRMGMVALVCFFLLWIDPAGLWPNAFVMMAVVNAAVRGLVERPQLFSYVIFSVMVWGAFGYLEVVEDPAARVPYEKKMLWGFMALQVIWVNLHGACILAYGVIAALLADRIIAWSHSAPRHSAEVRSRVRFLAILGGAVFLASFVSPETYHNWLYAFKMGTDRSGALISEWQPRPLAVYAKSVGWFWILAALSLGLGRKGRAFSLFLLAGMGYLSLKSFRHEIFFLFSATAVCFFQWKHSPFWKNWTGRLMRKRKLLLAVSMMGFLLILIQTRATAMLFARKGLSGVGEFTPARGAYDFLERENIQGRMFNNMDIGCYLVYRGYPNRPVFIDGRNVEYGFEVLRRSWLAGVDPAVWKELEDQYQFTYAVIGYGSIREGGLVPYCVHLDRNPDWKLVYLDDWTAVYLKDTPENRPIIKRVGNRFIDPSALSRLGAGSSLSESAGHSSRDFNNRGIFYARQGQFPEAQAEFRAALKMDPDDPATLNNIAGTYVQEGRWNEALPFYRSALQKNPWYAEAHCNLARTLSRLGQCGDAVREAQVASSLGSNVQELIRVIKGTCEEVKN